MKGGPRSARSCHAISVVRIGIADPHAAQAVGGRHPAPAGVIQPIRAHSDEEAPSMVVAMVSNDDGALADHAAAANGAEVADAWTAAADVNAAAHSTMPSTAGVSLTEGDCHNRRDCDDRRHDA